ncbi:phage scaffolding protein [Streptomyces sp. NPDC048200]|uniref:phage scaffolding protein n=1 Tax=Streptomyces sp. NPDC048200 TaxID=3365512 RepID=UPI00371D07E2
MGIQTDSDTETDTGAEVEVEETEAVDDTTTDDDSTTAEADESPKPKPPVKKTEAKPGDDDYVPTASEWRRTKDALSKANADAKRNRERARELEEQTRANETDHEKALREAREEGEKRFREPMKKSGVRAALAEAGFNAPERLMKLIDWDSITVDDDGALIGAEAEVDRVKGEYPELLPQDKPKPKVRPTGAPKPAAVEKPKSTAEQHAARILGRA